ncbi:unnamed protein product [Sympodiomycopsis kandeliae]
MKVFGSIVSLMAVAVAAVSAQADDTPQLKVTTTFPGNPLSLVKNGQANRVVFQIQNPPSQDRVLTLNGITGAWLNPKKEDGERGRVVRNMTTAPYKNLSLRSVGGKPLEVPFDFYPEFKPQSFGVEFRLLIHDGQTSKKYNIPAYQGKVTVIEPPKNLLDPQLWSVYLILLGLLAGSGYFLKQYFLPSNTGGKTPKKPSTSSKTARGGAAKPSSVAAAADVASLATAKGYDEDWIPEHHLKARKHKGEAQQQKSKK